MAKCPTCHRVHKPKVMKPVIPASKTFDNSARKRILNKILSSFYGEMQWADMKSYDNAAKYRNHAECLIELLEVDDCGSCGGFDKDNPKEQITEDDLFNRFSTVLRKYHTNKDLDEKRHGSVTALYKACVPVNSQGTYAASKP